MRIADYIKQHISTSNGYNRQQAPQSLASVYETESRKHPLIFDRTS